MQMAKANDVDFTLQVGRSEAHQVAFHWDSWHAIAVITVDGKEVLREKHPFAVKTIRRYEASVGESEVHSFVVVKRKPLMYGGLRKQSFQAFVDDELVGEY
jgi:hypothetical protein